MIELALVPGHQNCLTIITYNACSSLTLSLSLAFPESYWNIVLARASILCAHVVFSSSSSRRHAAVGRRLAGGLLQPPCTSRKTIQLLPALSRP